MSFVTRCPSCGTAFRVTREQLAAHFGSVRCGKCDGVFDGIAELVERGAERLSLEASPQPLPEFMVEQKPSHARSWLWALAALLAMLALAAQSAYRYRAEIAAAWPQARAPLEEACRWLECAIALPRRADMLSIESSDLQADPRRDGLIVLNAVLRNRSRLPQQYPALELTLTDEAGRPLLRRVLLPADYVGPDRSAHGIAAGAEEALRVYFDASRARATSYRLYLFYPA